MEWSDFLHTGANSAKSYFNDFRVGLVKNGYDHYVLETLKSAVS